MFWDNKDYKEVVSLLKQNGFTSVEALPMNDIIIGILSKENAVEEVLVNGDKIEKDTWYLSGYDVTVRYHSKKK